MPLVVKKITQRSIIIIIITIIIIIILSWTGACQVRVWSFIGCQLEVKTTNRKTFNFNDKKMNVSRSVNVVASCKCECSGLVCFSQL